MKKEWLRELDYFRGFAILGVLAAHSFYLPPPSILKYYEDYQNSPINDLIIQTVHSFLPFVIPLFIIVSGIALAYNYDDKINFIDFYKKRLVRIIPPYIFISLIAIFALGLLNQIPSIETIIFKLLTGTAADPLWFIVLIIQLYLIFPFIFIEILRWQRKSSIFFILFPAMALLIQIMWDLYVFQTPFIFTFFASFFFYFVIGIYFGIFYKETIFRIRTLPVLLPLVFSLGSFLFIFLKWNEPVLSVLLNLIFNISTIILTIKLTLTIIEQNFFLGSFIRDIGVISFGVYLINPFFVYIFWILLSKSSINPSDFIFFPLMFLLLVISSVLSIKILMRIPYHKWLIGV
jgi:peptidoglycan/LPS O-acetylase OafA/YrhL